MPLVALGLSHPSSNKCCYLSANCFIVRDDLRNNMKFCVELRKIFTERFWSKFTKAITSTRKAPDIILWHSRSENQRAGTYSTIKTFCNDCGKKFTKVYQNCGETTHGSYTSSLKLIISSALYQKSEYCSTPASIIRRPGSQWLFLFPKLKLLLKGRRFEDIKTNSP